MNTGFSCSCILFLLLTGNTIAQITFSEVMFDPATNEYHDEYVELFNLSYVDSISLTGWLFSDGQGTDVVLSHTGSIKIAPRSFALILDGSYFHNSTVYDNTIGQGISVYKIDNQSFGSNGLSNSEGESLVLMNIEADTICQYTYSCDNFQGHSDEKIFLDADNSPSNWTNSRIFGGTPATRNSVTPFDYDAALNEGAITVFEPVLSGESVHIAVRIEYEGIHTIRDSAGIFLYHYDDRSKSSGEKVLLTTIPLLFRSDSENSISYEWEQVQAGEHIIQAEFHAAWDMNPHNDTCSVSLTVLSGENALHINELKFLTDEGEPEWIEIVSTARAPVFLKFWSISDTKDTMQIDTSVFIHENQFKVITADRLPEKYEIADTLIIFCKNLPSLNNNGDVITLIEPSGTQKERIGYSLSWLEEEDYRNVSLERINPLLNPAFAENWGPCVAPQRATPGKKNSVWLDPEKPQRSFSVSPNPFSPDADGIDDATIICGCIAEKSARLRIRIFDINGRLVRSIADNQFSGNEFRVVWNGTNNEGVLLPIGIYIILIEALNDRNGIYLTEKLWVVLAQKL